MLHGPCGRNSGRPCSVTGKCRWGFPKAFAPKTVIKKNTYPVYARPNNGAHFEKNGYTYTNQNVATYNPVLLRLMDAHVNVEAVTWISLCKYLFSYIAKVGPFYIRSNSKIFGFLVKYLSGSIFPQFWI